jgi:hypothetical protein
MRRVPKDLKPPSIEKDSTGIGRRIGYHGHIPLMAEVPATPACFPAAFATS